MSKSMKNIKLTFLYVVICLGAMGLQIDELTQTEILAKQSIRVESANDKSETLTPRSDLLADIDPRNLPSEWVKLPNTLLSVKRSGTLTEQWGNYWSDDISSTATYPVMIDLRWITREQNLTGAVWQISRTPDFSNIRGFSSIPVPEPGEYSRFSIDLRPYISAGGGQYYIRVQPKKGGAHSTSGPVLYALVEPSASVTVVDQWPGPQTQFDQLPKLTVMFDRIFVEDDSDDLSPGDLGFGFWVHGQGPETHVAQVSSGSDTHPNISFTINNPPNVVFMRVFGFDNDEIEMMLIGPFIMFVLPTCGSIAGPSDDCPGDAADSTYAIETGMRTGTAKPETPFVMHANGPSLKFKVEGRYRLDPY